MLARSVLTEISFALIVSHKVVNCDIVTFLTGCTRKIIEAQSSCLMGHLCFGAHMASVAQVPTGVLDFLNVYSVVCSTINRTIGA